MEALHRFPCTKSLYPFHDGLYEDFEPIFNTLISKSIHSGYTDEYTREFVPTAERLVSEADTLAKSDPRAASAVYLRACAVYRIARFPYINSDYKREIYEAQKDAYIKAASLWECPIVDVEIPHTAGTDKDGPKVPLYVRYPKGASKSSPCPVVLLITGLDGHRPDNTTRTDEFLARGWGCVISDIPGTADCPADRSDPKSAERLWTSILDWMQDQGSFDMKRVVAWGLSAGGYNAVRSLSYPQTSTACLTGSTDHPQDPHSSHARLPSCRQCSPRRRLTPLLQPRMARKGPEP